MSERALARAPSPLAARGVRMAAESLPIDEQRVQILSHIKDNDVLESARAPRSIEPVLEKQRTVASLQARCCALRCPAPEALRRRYFLLQQPCAVFLLRASSQLRLQWASACASQWRPGAEIGEKVMR